jgi:hypothetical protein
MTVGRWKWSPVGISGRLSDLSEQNWRAHKRDLRLAWRTNFVFGKIDMLTVFVIIMILALWAIFGPLAFVRGSGSNLPVRQCPACGYKGRVVGFGRFKCGSCGHYFVLGYGGRPTTSLVVAMLPPFTITGIIVVALIAFWVREGDGFIYLPAVLVVQVGIMIFAASQPKRYPNIDAD